MPARVKKTSKEDWLAEGKLIVRATDDAKFHHKGKWSILCSR